MTGRVVCPYCFEDFKQRETMFRCLAQLTGRGTGTRCELEVDAQLAAYIGSPGPANLGPVFGADGSRRKAACPTCGVDTYTRICPSCHNDLPPDFGEVGAHIIALIGAKESGKSTYITVLVHELRQRVGAALNASVEAMDDRTIRRYAERFEKGLYRDHVMPPPTQPASVDVNYPLLYRLSTRRRGLLGDRPRSSALALFDTAGEDLESRASIDTHVRYLARADGIVVLVDPLQIEAVQQLVGERNALPAKNTPPDEIVANVTQLIRSGRGLGAGNLVKTPLAVAFSKLDALWPHLPAGSRLQQRADHAGGFDERDRLELSDEIQARLDAWEGGMLGRHIDQNYAVSSFFAFSAIGDEPVAKRVPSHGVSPFRVEDPVLWLLSRFGVVPVKAAKR